jgi:2-polyprenyl-3-methyl-5-hydroxy-6-metoxy-1,4-benzoquinol methylase
VPPPDVPGAAEQLQRSHFGDDFARRTNAFIRFYDTRNAKRVYHNVAATQDLRVLEIGPGRGAVMQRFAAQGHEVMGLDLSTDVISAIRQQGLAATANTLEEHLEVVGEGAYDLAIICHVLEHLVDPPDTLRTVGRLLRPGGRAYVAVPNGCSWHARFRGWAGYQPYHLHYFTRDTLAATSRLAGLRKDRLFTQESLTGWSNTIMASILKTSSKAPPANNGNTGATRWALEIGRLVLGLVTTPLRMLQARLGLGEELVLIATKPA